MEKNKNVPKLRFPEFTREWEEKKLGEIAVINPKTKKAPNSFIYIDLESVECGQLLKEERVELVNAPSRAQRVLSKGDVLFQMVRPYQRNNLYFDKEGEYVASTGYAQIKTINESRYIFQYLHFPKFTDKVIERCTGTSYPAINSTDLSNIQIFLPSHGEQTKIASFLMAVDEKLTQLKKKKTLLEQYKKGIMQKLFTQELRFKDNNNQDFPDWQEKTLGQIAELTSSKRVYLSDYVNEGIPFYRGKEISELKQNIQPKEILFISEKAYNDFKANYGVPSINDILITAVGTLGNVLKIRDNNPFYFKDGNLIWLKKINQNSDFLEYLLHVKHNEIENSAIGSSQKALTMVELRKLSFSFPSLPEQQKIATFLSSIDEKINHSSKQVEKMEAWKKGLLQQMFC